MRELDSMKNQLMTIGDPINITEMMFSNQTEDNIAACQQLISSFGDLRLIKNHAPAILHGIMKQLHPYSPDNNRN